MKNNRNWIPLVPCAILFLLTLTWGGSSDAQSRTNSFFAGSLADEAAIRAIVTSQSADEEDPHVALDLDWENAFGIRYTNLKKRNDWFNANIKPQFKEAENTTLEVKVRFLNADVAVADEYWRVIGQVYASATKPAAERWGRTTYIFKKVNGAWTEVMERVADLRSAYFKHYDTLPAAVPVAAEVLACYAGKYATSAGAQIADVTVSGDHLAIVSRREKLVAIPTSNTDFLGFNPQDLASYYQIAFSVTPKSKENDDSTVTMTLSWPGGELLATASKTF